MFYILTLQRKLFSVYYNQYNVNILQLSSVYTPITESIIDNNKKYNNYSLRFIIAWTLCRAINFISPQFQNNKILIFYNDSNIEEIESIFADEYNFWIVWIDCEIYYLLFKDQK
jgi:hypothetical protein